MQRPGDGRGCSGAAHLASADDSQPRWRVRRPIRRAYASLHPHRPQPLCRIVGALHEGRECWNDEDHRLTSSVTAFGDLPSCALTLGRGSVGGWLGPPSSGGVDVSGGCQYATQREGRTQYQYAEEGHRQQPDRTEEGSWVHKDGVPLNPPVCSEVREHHGGTKEWLQVARRPMTAGARCCRLLGLLYFAAIPQLPAAVPLPVPPASLPGGVRPVREPSRSAVKGGGHRGLREPPRDYVAGHRPHPLLITLTNTLSKSVGA